jgi:FF domain/WW domain
MLKSTHKAAALTSSEVAPLPPGWTEHKAPTGHSYYYNAETKQSTYTRPTAPHTSAFFIDIAANPSPFDPRPGQIALDSRHPSDSDYCGSFRGGLSYQDRSSRKQREDRPKKKRAITGCEPWILVTTKLGRRFVYNAEKHESFWKFPQDVLLATFEMDRKDREEKDRLEHDGPKPEARVEPRPILPSQQNNDRNQREAGDSDSYEEVEVTDDEGAGVDNLNVSGAPSKKQRRDSAPQAEMSNPVEYNEEDIAYQLAQMGQDYGLDPGEYGNGGYDEYDTGLPLSLEDSKALFYDLLSDNAINPYATWEGIIEEGRIINDERYVALPNMRARKEAFDIWSTQRVQELKDKRAKEEKKDPRIPYLGFLYDHATPKLYWPEFKRKYRKEEAMKDAHLSDKEREKLYRDHINQLKLPESTKKADLKELLKAISPTQLHQKSSLDTLPSAILTDIRFVSLPAKTRDPLIEAYISTLPAPPQPDHSHSGPSSTTEQQSAEADKREKRQQALREREKIVQEEKRKIMGKMREGRAVMREEEREIEEALRVGGKDGLRAYIEVVKTGGQEDYP